MQAKNTYLNSSALTSAIKTAQSVYDNTSATQDQLDAAVTTLNAAVKTAATTDKANVTYYITNNSFETGDATGWDYFKGYDTKVSKNEGGYATTGIDGNYLFNTWDGSSATFYVKQTLSSLPEGYYQLSALYASDTNNSATIYAGTSKVTANGDATGKTQFNTFTTPLVYVKDGGSLEIGATSTSWYKVDNFQLTYRTIDGASETVYKEALAAAKAALESSDYTNVMGEERTNLSDSINTYSSVTSDYKDAAKALTTATSNFTSVKATYDTFAAVKSAETNLPYASSEKLTALTTAKNATATSASDAETKTEAIATALRACVESNSAAEGVSGATDNTSYIKNPNAEATDGWAKTDNSTNNFNIGTVTANDDNSLTDASGSKAYNYFDTSAGSTWSMSAWNGTYQQTLTLPAGKYLLAVAARGSDGLATYQLFANDNATDLTHVNADAANGVFGHGWNDSYVVFTTAGSTTIGINMKATSAYQWASFARFRLHKIADLEAVTIDEDATTAPATTDDYVNVTLKRSFNANSWNTLVLPFDVSADNLKTLGDNVQVANFASATQNESTGNYTLNFTTSTTGIVANTPAFIWGASSDKTEFTFNGVKIASVADAPTVTNNSVAFVGSYVAGKAVANDYFISSGNKFYTAAGGETFKGTRAVFRTTSSSSAKIAGFTIDGTATGIQSVKTAANNNTDKMYNIAGQRVDSNYKGIIIVNGKKVINK